MLSEKTRNCLDSKSLGAMNADESTRKDWSRIIFKRLIDEINNLIFFHAINRKKTIKKLFFSLVLVALEKFKSKKNNKPQIPDLRFTTNYT